MAALVATVAIMVIFGTLATQAWIDVLRRDNEAEMIFRAEDLVRAIQRYRRDHGGAGPQKLEQLLEPGPRGQYYARRIWRDPLVPDGKWGLLYAGPAGQILDPNSAESGVVPGIGGDPGGAGVGLGPAGALNPDGGAGSVPGGQVGNTPLSGFQNTAEGDDEHAGGKQLAGVPIAGVRTLSEDNPFRLYKGLEDYALWQFTYLDLEQPQLPGQSKGKGPRHTLAPGAAGAVGAPGAAGGGGN